MKRFIFIILLCIAVSSVKAQTNGESKISFATTIGTGLSMSTPSSTPFIRFQIGRERKFTPYAEYATGYSFAPSGNTNGGFFMNPSIGIQYPLKNKMKLQLAVGYELQELERLKRHTDNYFLKEFEEQLSHHSISFKIGLRF